MPVITVDKLAQHIADTVQAIRDATKLLQTEKITAEMPDEVQIQVTVLTVGGAGAIQREQVTGEAVDVQEQTSEPNITEQEQSESKTNSGGDNQVTDYIYESDA